MHRKVDEWMDRRMDEQKKNRGVHKRVHKL